MLSLLTEMETRRGKLINEETMRSYSHGSPFFHPQWLKDKTKALELIHRKEQSHVC